MNVLKILLMEDNPMDQLIIQNVTDYAGFEMEMADNGRLGIDKLLSGHFDLVLMDLEMPLMNGYDATTYIRQHLGDKKDIPIIVITSKDGMQEAARCLLLGANTFLTKPVTLDNLIKEINTLVI